MKEVGDKKWWCRIAGVGNVSQECQKRNWLKGWNQFQGIGNRVAKFAQPLLKYIGGLRKWVAKFSQPL